MFHVLYELRDCVFELPDLAVPGYVQAGRGIS